MIFISYRREDSAAITGRIYDRLESSFGHGKVFMDFDSIPIGADFRTHIVTSLRSCKVLIAVIGTSWDGRTPDGRRRIDDPSDFVRIEVASALQCGISVIPVLVGGATLPPVSQLPDDLHDLVFRNGVKVDATVDFRHHVDRLIGGIQKLLESPPAIQSPPQPAAPATAPPPSSVPAREETEVRSTQPSAATASESVPGGPTPADAMPAEPDPFQKPTVTRETFRTLVIIGGILLLLSLAPRLFHNETDAKYVSIESSDLKMKSAKGSEGTITLVVRNGASYAMQPPALRLTFTDKAEKTLDELVVKLEEHLPAGSLRRLPPGTTNFTVPIDRVPPGAVGFRAFVFYP